jgi:hypothetical protein
MGVYRLHRGVDARDVAAAHAAALEYTGGPERIWVVSGATPFQPADLPVLAEDAPAIVRLRAPELAAAYDARGWLLPNTIDRVYVSARATRDRLAAALRASPRSWRCSTRSTPRCSRRCAQCVQRRRPVWGQAPPAGPQWVSRLARRPSARADEAIVLHVALAEEHVLADVDVRDPAGLVVIACEQREQPSRLAHEHVVDPRRVGDRGGFSQRRGRSPDRPGRVKV